MSTTRSKYYMFEKILKGVANHRRIEILFLLDSGVQLSTDDIVTQLNINYQTGSAHVRKLVSAGLVTAYRQDKFVLHELSPVGMDVITFLKMSKW